MHLTQLCEYFLIPSERTLMRHKPLLHVFPPILMFMSDVTALMLGL
jgi:hypothetical protein